MNKNLLFTLFVITFCDSFKAQNIIVFNDVPFYSMYHYLGEGETLPSEAYTQIPEGAIRLHAYERDIISRKLTDIEIATLGNSITMNITLTAACDNYDRLAGVNLVLVPKGSTTYTWDQQDVKRVEIGRFITPFMNKNKSPTSVPYTYQIDNISDIIHNPTIQSQFDFWIEFRADGYSAAANTQVAGCADRTDVFRGTLEFTSSGTAIPNNSYFLPISYRDNLNNYNATDVEGETTRIVHFTLEEPVENAVLFLISSNHGSNSGGEEYNRRDHYIYLDNELVHQYKPGGKSCEPYRQYNTQSNGIYGSNSSTLRNWLANSNWCPGDKVPNREVKLGNLTAGEHTIKIDVPTAKFTGQQGYIPLSMYIQNSTSGQIVCATPTALQVLSQESQSVKVGWTERGNANNWEVLWGRKNVYSTTYDTYQEASEIPETTKSDLVVGRLYEIYVKSKCTDNTESVWSGPAYTEKITLDTYDSSKTTKVSLYPNPVNNILHIQTSLLKKVTLFNMEGKKLSESTASEINFSRYPKGVYIITTELSDGSISTQKIIKN